MNKDYQKLVKKITEEVIKSLETSNYKKANWENVTEIDYSFGGSLKSFSKFLNLKNIDIVLGEFRKGEGLKKHYHKVPTEEVYYILEGEVEVAIEDRKITARKGDIFSIPPSTVHCPINNNYEICRILFIL